MSSPCSSNKTETWLRVLSHPEYEVSSEGRLRRGAYVKAPQRHPRGYVCYGIGKHGKALAHRLVCEAFHGPPPTPEHEVAHNDGTRDHNSADNLRWALPGENQADRKHHGTYMAGEQCVWSVKLTDESVAAIRDAYAQGGKPFVGGSVTMQTLADTYGVSLAQISRVVNGRQRRTSGDLRYD